LLQRWPRLVRLQRGFAALETATGRVSWTWTTPKGTWRVLLDDELLFVLSTNGVYRVLSVGDGNVLLESDVWTSVRRKWPRMQPAHIGAGLAMTTTHGWFGDTSGRLYALDRRTGAVTWTHRPSGSTGYVGITPVITNRGLFVTTFGGGARHPAMLYCYRTQTKTFISRRLGRDRAGYGGPGLR
jgi:hypothetical protein